MTHFAGLAVFFAIEPLFGALNRWKFQHNVKAGTQEKESEF